MNKRISYNHRNPVIARNRQTASKLIQIEDENQMDMFDKNASRELGGIFVFIYGGVGVYVGVAVGGLVGVAVGGGLNIFKFVRSVPASICNSPSATQHGSL